MYANRIIKIYKALNTADLPKEEEDREIEMLMWKGFFNNYIVPGIEGLCSVDVGKSYYKYKYLQVRPLGRMKGSIPSLEVRDRDCLGKKIKSLILTYEMSGKRKRIPDWDRIIDINKALPESGFKPCRKNATKTVLLTDDKKVCDSTEFLEELKKCINIYLEIMNQLENRG